jgi:hypothetical protein
VNTKYLVAIDPGVSAGVAVFDARSKRLAGATVVKGRGRTWEERVCDVAAQITHVVGEFDCSEVGDSVVRIVCEYPAFMPTPGGIKIAKRGDLVKLAHAVGVLHGMFNHMELVPVRKWKGQASKDVINNRTVRIVSASERKAAGMSVDRSHDWDAVGIGLWALGRKS